MTEWSETLTSSVNRRPGRRLRLPGSGGKERFMEGRVYGWQKGTLEAFMRENGISAEFTEADTRALTLKDA